MRAIGVLTCLAVLVELTSGVEIQCWYSYENDFHGRDLYTCWATILNEENPTIVTEVRGNHLEGRTNEDVKDFIAFNYHTRLTTIPAGIGNFFGNLQAFDWRSGGISSIDSSTFAPFRNLTFIDLGWNKLVSLDGHLFQHTGKLQGVVFRGNLLEHVGHGLFTGLTDLTYADFEINKCIDTWANTPLKIQELNRQLPIQCPPHRSTDQ